MQRQHFSIVSTCSLIFWPKYASERYLKKHVLEPKCAVLVPPSPCLLANHITLPGREIPGAGRMITLPKGHHPALSKSLHNRQDVFAFFFVFVVGQMLIL